VLQLPPYNFSPGINGLINIPAFSQFPNHFVLLSFDLKCTNSFSCTVGNLVGAFTGGYLTDVFARFSARRNSGRFLPESRLVLLIVPALTVPVGLLMFGFGSERKLHWAVIFVGYGFINVVNGAASIAMTYVMDSYFEVAAECLLMINGMKNVVAFGFTYGFIPWTVSAGYETVRALMDFALLSEIIANQSTGLWSHGGHLAGGNAHGYSPLLVWCHGTKLHYHEVEGYILVMLCRLYERPRFPAGFL
jgi:hypothetical protein